MDFRALPDAPDHPRYLKRLKDVEHLLRQRRERLVEEGMLIDRATGEDDLHWFCKRFTSYRNWRIDYHGHPLRGSLWIDHPFLFWVCRRYQEVLTEPQNGWVWIKFHRLAHKTTILLASGLWIHARDSSKTILLTTHTAEKIGTGMGRGLLADLQTDALRDHFPQFRRLQEGTKQGYVVDRAPGPREQSLTISGILSSVTSMHPDIYFLDDVVTDKLRDNPEQIAKISKNISALAALMPPGAPVICCNTPWDESDPLVQREKDGDFARVFAQAATNGGSITTRLPSGKLHVEPGFTPPGTANLHTAEHFARQRRDIKDDSIYFPQFELEFHRSSSVLFDWSWIHEYEEHPETIARASPYVNIIVDGAKGTKKSDFTVIRIITWTGHDRWANLELIRERIGLAKTMQILLGRDKTDATSHFIEEMYCPGGVGLIEKWMRIDPELTVWFDDSANSGWIENFHEMVRVRSVRFIGGKMPKVKAWPQIHNKKGDIASKAWRIQQLEGPYQQGRVAYPKRGFGHGSYQGLGGGRDTRDVVVQFRQDEYERMQIGQLPPYDDLLDSESVLCLEKATAQMRRPRKGGGFHFGGVEFPATTTSNPFGVPGGGTIMGNNMQEGRTWTSM